MKKLQLLLVAAALTGCVRVPVVKPAPLCKLPEPLMQECKVPVELKEGITYSELLQRYQEDRQSLVLCGKQQKELRDTVQACTTHIEDYNRALEQLQSSK